MLKSGEIILENFISHSELDKAVEIMSRLPTGTYQYGSSKDYFNKSIGIGHVLYNWFNKKIIDRKFLYMLVKYSFINSERNYLI